MGEKRKKGPDDPEHAARRPATCATRKLKGYGQSPDICRLLLTSLGMEARSPVIMASAKAAMVPCKCWRMRLPIA